MSTCLLGWALFIIYKMFYTRLGRVHNAEGCVKKEGLARHIFSRLSPTRVRPEGPPPGGYRCTSFTSVSPMLRSKYRPTAVWQLRLILFYCFLKRMEPETLSTTVALCCANHAACSGCGGIAPAILSVLTIVSFLTRQHQSGCFAGGCRRRPISVS